MMFKYQDVLFPAFDVLLNGFNFFMHIYISWYVSLNEYSVLNASLALLAIMFVLGISVQTYTTKEVAKAREDMGIISDIFTVICGLGLLLSCLVLLSAPLITHFMRTGLLTIILIVLIFNVNLLLSFFRGIMQSHQKFIDLNKSFYVEVLSKLVLLIILLPLFPGTTVPLICILVGMLLSLVHAYRFVRKTLVVKLRLQRKGFRILKPLFHVVSSNFFLYYLTSINLIVANYYIGERAGLYAVSLKFSQLIVAVGFSVMTVLVAYASELVTQPDTFRKYINKWILRYCLGGIIILLGYQLVIQHMIGFLFGETYQGASAFVVIQGFAYTLLTISYFIISVLIILNSRVQLYILGAVSIFLTTGLILNHDSIMSIIVIEIMSFGLMFVGLLVSYYRKEHAYEKKYSA